MLGSFYEELAGLLVQLMYMTVTCNGIYCTLDVGFCKDGFESKIDAYVSIGCDYLCEFDVCSNTHCIL